MCVRNVICQGLWNLNLQLLLLYKNKLFMQLNYGKGREEALPLLSWLVLFQSPVQLRRSTCCLVMMGYRQVPA